MTAQSEKNFSFMLALPEEQSQDELRQGDILQRNRVLSESISQAHQYYAEAEGYDYFLVLTPTCELVRRSGKCSSRYITLAAIRPLSLLVDRQLQNYKKSVKAPGLYCALEKRQNAEQFLMRLLHNAEDGHLFIPSELFPANDIDRCAFLKLSIALRAEHYDACVAAKVQQLATDFSAKVGHLTANLYGQVATQALEEQVDINVQEIIAAFRERHLDRDGVVWLSKARLKELDKRAKAKAKELARDLTPEEARFLLEGLPTDQMLLASRIAALMQNKAIGDASVQQEFQNLVASDQAISQMFR